MSEDNWSEKQLQPLNMFELAKNWIAAIKVLGAGNGAGLAATGAALNAFEKHPGVMLWIKLSGFSFLFGVVTFVVAFLAIHIAVFQFDEMLHAIQRKDKKGIEEASQLSTATMSGTNYLVMASTAAFFSGLLAGLIVLILY